ncbi:MAG: hypothetical protein JSS61_07215 [Verrucomicrobia bacterium]|nr:hypothetical protein [Verrucomicrobiota bacterium]
MVFISCLLILSLLSGCSKQEEEATVDYERMVKLEEELEWTKGSDLISDLDHDLQERLIVEVPE